MGTGLSSTGGGAGQVRCRPVVARPRYDFKYRAWPKVSLLVAPGMRPMRQPIRYRRPHTLWVFRMEVPWPNRLLEHDYGFP
jgi:hypothetical protein